MDRDLTTGSVQRSPEKRLRRKADIARTTIIAAARELFAERGYARTTTREIALKAQSSEVLLFRYFQSKANLFREAVIDPFNQFLKTFLDVQAPPPGSEPFAESQAFIERLFGAFSDHRDIMLALISTRLYEAGHLEEQVKAGGFKDYFRAGVEQMEVDLAAMGVKPSISPEISSRISFTTVMAIALFKDWIFSEAEFGQEDILVALTKYIIGGTTGLGARHSDQR